MRSHTGETLAPVLEAGPHVERKLFDFAAQEVRREEDLEINEIGRETQMPWEADGRGWHTRDRVGRTGQPCRWDGEILAGVIDRVQELGQFAPTNWNNRTVVEITERKETDGWFLHAVTGEEWLLQLKFRVAKKSFQRDDLIARLDLKPLNEIHELPVYGSDPRVKCKNLRGPWQEVQLPRALAATKSTGPSSGNSWTQAVAGFQRFAERAEQRPEDIMPWKVLGQKWHLVAKAFRRQTHRLGGRSARRSCASCWPRRPRGQFLWNNQQVVHVCPPGGGEPWATIHTKRQAGIDLSLAGPKGRFASGASRLSAVIRNCKPTGPTRTWSKLRFVDASEISTPELFEFLASTTKRPAKSRSARWSVRVCSGTAASAVGGRGGRRLGRRPDIRSARAREYSAGINAIEVLFLAAKIPCWRRGLVRKLWLASSGKARCE